MTRAGPRRLALLSRLQSGASHAELADRLAALAVLLLWAEMSAASARNDHRPAWMRTAPAGGHRRNVARARRSINGRRARG
jgi:hypothetical protein